MNLNSSFDGVEDVSCEMPQPALCWHECYDRPVRPADKLRFLNLVEMFYHKTKITEWGMAFVRWIVFVGEHIRPIACYKLTEVAAHFHLSERQTWRNIQALKNNRLLRITTCFDKNGKKSKYRRYDCTPFLNYIAELIREHVQTGQLQEACACPGMTPVVVPESCMTSSLSNNELLIGDGASFSDTSVPTNAVSDVSPASYMTSDPSDDESTAEVWDTSVPNDAIVFEAPESCMTLCPSVYGCATEASSPFLDTSVTPCAALDGTHMFTPAAANADAGSEPDMSWMSIFCLLPASNSSLNLDYSNYNNINISTSNSKYTHAQEAVDDLLIPPTFFTSGDTDEKVREPQLCEQLECITPLDCCPIAANEQATIESQQAEYADLFEQCAAEASEQRRANEQAVINDPDCKATTCVRKRACGAKEAARQRINALLAESRDASDAELGAHAKITIHRISRDFNDMAAYASQVQATTLFRHLLRINHVDDQYTLPDIELFFTEMMQGTYEKLRHVAFRRTDSQRRPNGMPLFFTDLREQVVQLVEHIQRRRAQEASVSASAQQDYGVPAWKPQHPLTSVDDPLSASDSHSLLDYVETIPLDDPEELVAHARRLDVFLSDEDVRQILSGTASELLLEQVTEAVRQGFYYEIKDSCVVQPGYRVG